VCYNSWIPGQKRSNLLCNLKAFRVLFSFAAYKYCFSYRVGITFETSIYIGNFNIYLLLLIAQIMFSLQIKLRTYSTYFYMLYRVF